MSRAYGWMTRQEPLRLPLCDGLAVKPKGRAMALIPLVEVKSQQALVLGRPIEAVAASNERAARQLEGAGPGPGAEGRTETKARAWQLAGMEVTTVPGSCQPGGHSPTPRTRCSCPCPRTGRALAASCLRTCRRGGTWLVEHQAGRHQGAIPAKAKRRKDRQLRLRWTGGSRGDRKQRRRLQTAAPSLCHCLLNRTACGKASSPD